MNSMLNTVTCEPSRVTKRTTEEISSVMKQIGSKHTSPEITFRKALWEKGLRYRVCKKELPGKPDVVFASKRIAIFIDGDYWHGNQWRKRGFDSLASHLQGIRNKEYWVRKISKNIERDFKNTAALIDSGWKVLRFWESDIQNSLEKCVDVTQNALANDNDNQVTFSELSRLSIAEFFAGIGLVRLAFERRNWKGVYANDIDGQKYEMYKENFGAKDFQLEDIHSVSADDVPSAALFTASFPCNDLSVAGARNGLDGKQSGAFWGFIRLVREMGHRKPPLILLENVPGFLTSNQGRDFETALKALNGLGYSCDAFILDAASFVPQSRARLFVVAKIGDASVVPPWLSASPIRPKQLVHFIQSHPEIKWDIRPVPEPPVSRGALESILEEIPADSELWWSRKRVDYFMGQLSPKHRKISDFMIAQPEYSYGTAFRRIRNGRSMAELRVDGIAGCLRTPRGGSGRQILFKGGKGGKWVRLLTPRECARLQGVQDAEFRISAPFNKALFGFGDAVCVPVVEWIVEHYLQPVASELLRGKVLLSSRG